MNYTEGDVNVNSTTIHYYRTGGDKPPMVLLHGVTDNGLCWLPVAELLADKYDIIMIDAEGHGKSDPLDDNFSYWNHADQAVAVLNELGVTEKPVIMGHSMGAGNAVNLSIQYPGVPKGIILEDPAWRRQEAAGEAPDEEVRKIREGFARMLASYGAMTEEEIAAEGRRDNPTWSEGEIIPWAQSKKQFDTTMFDRAHMNPAGYEELVPKLDVPTLLICSDGGIVTKGIPEKAEKCWKSDKPFTWVRIKGAGHNIRRERTEAFMAAVNDFLKSLD